MNVREKKNHWREIFRHPENQEANHVVAVRPDRHWNAGFPLAADVDIRIKNDNLTYYFYY